MSKRTSSEQITMDDIFVEQEREKREKRSVSFWISEDGWKKSRSDPDVKEELERILLGFKAGNFYEQDRLLFWWVSINGELHIKLSGERYMVPREERHEVMV